MTTTHAAAQAELTHAGRPVSQEEQDRWFKGAVSYVRIDSARAGGVRGPFAPHRRIIDPLAAKLLEASNAIHLYKRILP